MSEKAQPILARYGDVPEGYDPKDPWALDLAPQRKELADSLTRLFRQSNKPFVLAVNAGWGMGKSLFLRMWRDDLQNQGHPCVLFNAWDYDHADAPLLSFITALDRQVNSTWPDKLKKKGKDFIRSVPQKIPAALNAAAQRGITAFLPGTGIEEVVGEGLEKAAAALISGSKQVAEDRDTFRRELAGFAQKLTKDAPGPLIIMVDELDRCRPDFAIALLEDIKHLFSVEGVVFVLAVEKKQLSNCIGATYGLDAEGSALYLNKFIDMTMELPAPDIVSFMRMLASTYPLPDPDNWPENFRKPNWLSKVPSDYSPLTFTDLAIEIICHFPFSLRDLTQIFCRLSLVVQRKGICSLTAVASVVLLAWIQKGGSFAEGVKGLYQLGYRHHASHDPLVFSMAPSLYSSEALFRPIFYYVVWKNDISDFMNYRSSITRSTENMATDVEAINYFSGFLSHTPNQAGWLANLEECILLTEKITTG